MLLRPMAAGPASRYKTNGASGSFQGSLEPLEWCQMAPTSMEELSVRYMEPFRTSLDILHTYGTHVNMSIFFSDQLQRCLKPPSPRRPRSSHRPRHGKPRIYTCRSRRARNAQRSNEANPIPQTRKRHRSRSLPKLRCSQRAARTRKSPLPCTNARD